MREDLPEKGDRVGGRSGDGRDSLDSFVIVVEKMELWGNKRGGGGEGENVVKMDGI
jgi:hypothetical protein